jgi:hypothetical protein
MVQLLIVVWALPWMSVVWLVNRFAPSIYQTDAFVLSWALGFFAWFGLGLYLLDAS